MSTKEIIQDLILRGFKVSSICEKLNMPMKQVREFVIHPSRSEIAEYQISYIRDHYPDDKILDAFLELKKADDLQTKINRIEYHTLGCAFGLYKTVFETLLGHERFGDISKEFRRKKTEKTVMERYGVSSVSMDPNVIKKRKQTMDANRNNPPVKRKPNITVSEDIANQVKDLTLRGFNRYSIRKKLNVSQPVMQTIGFYPSRDDIVEYQVQYIGAHYTMDEIITALREIHKMEDFQALANRHELHALGCSFGSLARPFSKLLGITQYKEIVNDAVRERRLSSGVLEKAAEKRRQTCIRTHGVEYPNQNKKIANKMVETLKGTLQSMYGVDNIMKCPNVSAEASIKRQQTMMKLYGAANSVQIPEIREKIMESRRRNGTLSTSIYEVEAKKLLIDHFGPDDVQQSVKDDRYPYYVDFYIKSRDLFIEMNTDASHCRHWFDQRSEDDKARLARLQELANGSNRPSRYRNMIRVWTVADVEKRACAKAGSLNYLVFWDDKTCVRDHKRIPLLRDFHEWMDVGCPDACDWHGHDENRY